MAHPNAATDATYAFGTGIGDDEVARIETQGEWNAPATRMIFTEAGIRPGMRVLDLGSGAGDAACAGADGFRRADGSDDE